jgi:hypothetical protein
MLHHRLRPRAQVPRDKPDRTTEKLRRGRRCLLLRAVRIAERGLLDDVPVLRRDPGLLRELLGQRVHLDEHGRLHLPAHRVMPIA